MWLASFLPMAALKVGAIFSSQCENNKKCWSSQRKKPLCWRNLPSPRTTMRQKRLYAVGDLRARTTRTNYKDGLILLWRTTCADTLRAKAIRASLLTPHSRCKTYDLAYKDDQQKFFDRPEHCKNHGFGFGTERVRFW